MGHVQATVLAVTGGHADSFCPLDTMTTNKLALFPQSESLCDHMSTT